MEFYTTSLAGIETKMSDRDKYVENMRSTMPWPYFPSSLFPCNVNSVGYFDEL